jgi:hypothetical protein
VYDSANTASFCYSVLFRNTVQSCCMILRHLNRWLFNFTKPSYPGLVCNNDTCHAAGLEGVAARSLCSTARSLCMSHFATLLGFCAVLPNLRATHPRQAPQSKATPPVRWSDPAELPLWRAGDNSGPALATVIRGRRLGSGWSVPSSGRIQSDFTRSIFGRRRRLSGRRPFYRTFPHFGVSLCGLER